MKRSRLRRLNDAGNEQMRQFLESQSTETPMAYPSYLLTEDACTESIGAKVEVEQREFRRRYDMSEYLYSRFKDSDLRNPEREAGIWSWLALFWFEQLCPPDNEGNLNPQALARWLPELDSATRYYRHLVLGPYLIYAAYARAPKTALGLLETPPHAPGDIVEQFASRPQLVTCPAAVGAITKLYCRPQGGFRKGAAGKDDSPGSARRLATVLMQFDRTYDLHSLSVDDLLSLLPKEFDRFRVAV